MITTFGVTDHRMIWVVIISMVTWLPTFADGQESNVCSYSGQTSERQSALCRNYINMINSGYMLLSNETSLNRGELTSITQGQKESDEMCTFFRSYIHTWEDCCSGWAGPDCTEPICTTACVYGQCTEPDICTCDPGYTGYSCEDTSIGYYNREQYCYGSSTCWGPKAEGFGQERVTMQQCCEASNSNGWGSLGSRCDDCENYSKGISVINQDIDLGYRTCLSFGRSHYRTYDGREYKFPGNCKYVLSADYAGQWEVNVEMVNCETLQTCRKKVTVKFHIGETLELFEGRSFIDGQEIILQDQVPFSTTRYLLRRNGDYILASDLGTNIRIKVDSMSTVYLTLDNDYARTLLMVVGLCGNSNGFYSDDFMTRLGIMTTDATTFANSWIDDQYKTCPNAVQIPNYCSEENQKAAQTACDVILSDIFIECREKFNYGGWYQMCINEYCLAPAEEKENVLCQELEGFAQECAAFGVVVNWRTSTLCPRPCPSGFVYSECCLFWPTTCSDIFVDVSTNFINGPCVSGCECPSNYVLQNGQCVLPTECNCHYNKQSYAPGESLRIDCNVCECILGRWSCTEERCAKTAKMLGLSHICTLDGKCYDILPTACTYTFMTTRPQPTYVAHLDLTIKVAFDTCDWTIPETNRYCLSSVIIIYKSTTIIITDTEISVNGQSYPRAHNTYPYRSNDIIIKQATTAFLTVKGFGFFLLYDSHKSLFLTLDRFFMYKVYGLAGTYDDITTNDFETISGSLEVEPHIFADDFKDCIDTSQQYTQSCPSLQQATADYLCDPLLSHPAFATCVAHINSQYFHDKCKLDVCGVKPENAAQIACYWTAAMAGTCAQLGPDYVVSWMDYMTWTMCASYTPCAAGSEYTDCASICSGRSHDLQYPDPSCQEICVPGCECPVGMLYSELHDGSCVYPEDAGCFDPYSNTYVFPNEVSFQGCTNCTCDSGTWICDVDNCDMVCPKNQVFQKAISVCEVTCEDIDKSQPCATLLTHDRCACPDNMYKTADGTCVDGSECPCNRFGQLFAPGSIYKESCKTFRCIERKWIKIQEDDCPSVCWISGESHFSTFDNTYYSFQGSCKYTLVRQRNGASPFNISAQTVPCGSSGIACTRKVTINLYENVTITMMRDAPLEVAGVAVTGDSYSDNLLEISVVFPWISVFVPSLQLAVLWDNGTRLNIRLGTEWTGNVEGLCGTFDNNGNNDFLGQDGMTYSSDNVISFANSWKTNPFCGDVPVDADQSAACSGDLATRADWAEDKCKVIMEGELFSECRTHVSVDPHQYYSDCLFDACGCSSGGDCECMCTAIANFAEACNRAGVSVSWRNPWTCPMMCDGGKVYMSCHSPCHQTCKNIGDEPSNYCVNTPCVEGCFCPDGFVHNDDGQCVSAGECPCYHLAQEYMAGTVLEYDCKTCTCTQGVFHCVGDSCSGCEDDQYACANGYCIPAEFQCDSLPDCQDGSDELDCNCGIGQFQCDNDHCIHQNYVCDGFRDCLDSSDEVNCTYECVDKFPDSFLCTNGNCLPSSFHCDGYIDCDDVSDEANCNNTEPCDEDTFYRCEDTGECYPRILRCDRHDDCGDGSDEINCDELIEKVPTTTQTPTTIMNWTPEPTTVTTEIPTTTMHWTPERTKGTTQSPATTMHWTPEPTTATTQEPTTTMHWTPERTTATTQEPTTTMNWTPEATTATTQSPTITMNWTPELTSTTTQAPTTTMTWTPESTTGTTQPPATTMHWTPEPTTGTSQTLITTMNWTPEQTTGTSQTLITTMNWTPEPTTGTSQTLITTMNWTPTPTIVTTQEPTTTINMTPEATTATTQLPTTTMNWTFEPTTSTTQEPTTNENWTPEPTTGITQASTTIIDWTSETKTSTAQTHKTTMNWTPEPTTGTTQPPTTTMNWTPEPTTGTTQPPTTNIKWTPKATSAKTQPPTTNMNWTHEPTSGTTQPPTTTMNWTPEPTTGTTQTHTTTMNWTPEPTTGTKQEPTTTENWTPKPTTETTKAPTTTMNWTPEPTTGTTQKHITTEIWTPEPTTGTTQAPTTTENWTPEPTTGITQASTTIINWTSETKTSTAQTPTATMNWNPEPTTGTTHPPTTTMNWTPEPTTGTTKAPTTIINWTPEATTGTTQAPTTTENWTPEPTTGTTQKPTITENWTPESTTGTIKAPTTTQNGAPEPTAETTQKPTITENWTPESTTGTTKAPTTTENGAPEPFTSTTQAPTTTMNWTPEPTTDTTQAPTATENWTPELTSGTTQTPTTTVNGAPEPTTGTSQATSPTVNWTPERTTGTPKAPLTTMNWTPKPTTGTTQALTTIENWTPEPTTGSTKAPTTTMNWTPAPSTGTTQKPTITENWTPESTTGTTKAPTSTDNGAPELTTSTTQAPTSTIDWTPEPTTGTTPAPTATENWTPGPTTGTTQAPTTTENGETETTTGTTQAPTTTMNWTPEPTTGTSQATTPTVNWTPETNTGTTKAPTTTMNWTPEPTTGTTQKPTITENWIPEPTSGTTQTPTTTENGAPEPTTGTTQAPTTTMNWTPEPTTGTTQKPTITENWTLESTTEITKAPKFTENGAPELTTSTTQAPTSTIDWTPEPTTGTTPAATATENWTPEPTSGTTQTPTPTENGAPEPTTGTTQAPTTTENGAPETTTGTTQGPTTTMNWTPESTTGTPKAPITTIHWTPEPTTGTTQAPTTTENWTTEPTTGTTKSPITTISWTPAPSTGTTQKPTINEIWTPEPTSGTTQTPTTTENGAPEPTTGATQAPTTTMNWTPEPTTETPKAPITTIHWTPEPTTGTTQAPTTTINWTPEPTTGTTHAPTTTENWTTEPTTGTTKSPITTINWTPAPSTGTTQKPTINEIWTPEPTSGTTQTPTTTGNGAPEPTTGATQAPTTIMNWTPEPTTGTSKATIPTVNWTPEPTSATTQATTTTVNWTPESTIGITLTPTTTMNWTPAPSIAPTQPPTTTENWTPETNTGTTKAPTTTMNWTPPEPTTGTTQSHTITMNWTPAPSKAPTQPPTTTENWTPETNTGTTKAPTNTMNWTPPAPTTGTTQAPTSTENGAPAPTTAILQSPTSTMNWTPTKPTTTTMNWTPAPFTTTPHPPTTTMNWTPSPYGTPCVGVIVPKMEIRLSNETNGYHTSGELNLLLFNSQSDASVIFNVIAENDNVTFVSINAEFNEIEAAVIEVIDSQGIVLLPAFRVSGLSGALSEQRNVNFDYLSGGVALKVSLTPIANYTRANITDVSISACFKPVCHQIEMDSSYNKYLDISTDLSDVIPSDVLRQAQDQTTTSLATNGESTFNLSVAFLDATNIPFCSVEFTAENVSHVLLSYVIDSTGELVEVSQQLYYGQEREVNVSLDTSKNPGVSGMSLTFYGTAGTVMEIKNLVITVCNATGLNHWVLPSDPSHTGSSGNIPVHALCTSSSTTTVHWATGYWGYPRIQCNYVLLIILEDSQSGKIQVQDGYRRLETRRDRRR